MLGHPRQESQAHGMNREREDTGHEMIVREGRELGGGGQSCKTEEQRGQNPKKLEGHGWQSVKRIGYRVTERGQTQ